MRSVVRSAVVVHLERDVAQSHNGWVAAATSSVDQMYAGELHADVTQEVAGQGPTSHVDVEDVLWVAGSTQEIHCDRATLSGTE